MSFAKRHPTYTEHKLSVKQCKVLNQIVNDDRHTAFRPTLDKLERCELVYKVNHWPGHPQCELDYWYYYPTQAGLDALAKARQEGF